MEYLVLGDGRIVVLFLFRFFQNVCFKCVSLVVNCMFLEVTLF